MESLTGATAARPNIIAKGTDSIRLRRPKRCLPVRRHKSPGPPVINLRVSLHRDFACKRRFLIWRTFLTFWKCELRHKSPILLFNQFSEIKSYDYSGAPLQRSPVMNWALPPLQPAGRFHRREGEPAHRRCDPLRRSRGFSGCDLTSRCSDELDRDAHTVIASETLNLAGALVRESPPRAQEQNQLTL
jgi:hypothetical protein